jgi:predicted O-linked N-acetylglucosamine transferase (SPINDLY family)
MTNKEQLIDSWMNHAKSGSMPLDELLQKANGLQGQGLRQEALTLYKIWIACTQSPSKFAALFNWGVMLAEQGETEAAEAAYRQCLALNPGLAQARINLGLMAERKGQFDEAIHMWRSVTESNTQTQASTDLQVFALNNIGRLLETRKQYEAAEQALVTSLLHSPRQPDALQHYVHLRQKQCKWPVLEALPNVRPNALLAATSPLAMLALTDEPAMQWLSAQSFLTRKYKLTEHNLSSGKRYKHKKIRIGYLSGDLCTHAVGLLMADLIEAHDRQKFDIFAFDFSPEDNTAYRARLKQSFDHVIDVRALQDIQAAELILFHEIDVLIDLHGLSSGARPGILALRPAPHQGTYLGFIGTTAMPWIDFVITDTFALPAALTPYFSETPLYIDGSVIPLHHEPVVRTDAVTREKMGLPHEAKVMACFNNIYKITPEMFDCWMRILRQTPNSLLWLLDDNPWATDNLKKQAQKIGMQDRIVFAQRCSHAEYRERLCLANIYLDTFPYNAGSTARDVLDAHLPMVTCSGDTFISRMAGSMLHAAGLHELITETMEDYETRVISLVNHPNRLTWLKQHISQISTQWQAAPHKLIRSLENQLSQRVKSQT